MGRGAAYVGAAIVVLGLAGTRVAMARDTPPVERLSLEELMGVRVRTPAMSSQQMETAPSMISVLTAEQIHALGLRTLSEAIALMPGVTVLQSQLGGHRIVVRGRANPNDVLVQPLKLQRFGQADAAALFARGDLRLPLEIDPGDLGGVVLRGIGDQRYRARQAVEQMVVVALKR